MLMSDIRRLDDEQLKLEADSLQANFLKCGAKKPPQKSRTPV